MGSDAHNLRHRNTNLKDAKEKISEQWGEKRAIELFETKPNYILENKLLPDDLYSNRLPGQFAEQPNGNGKKKSFFARLFG
jgi:tyrosine-protein phosphatase YwqE